MPLNTVRCSNCNAHINYSVDVSEGEQTVVCKRCKTPNVVARSTLDERTLEAARELAANQSVEDTATAEYEKLRDVDTVEEAIGKAEAAFRTAKGTLLDLASSNALDTNMDNIASQYIVDETKDVYTYRDAPTAAASNEAFAPTPTQAFDAQAADGGASPSTELLCRALRFVTKGHEKGNDVWGFLARVDDDELAQMVRIVQELRRDYGTSGSTLRGVLNNKQVILDTAQRLRASEKTYSDISNMVDYGAFSQVYDAVMQAGSGKQW